jgi:hypothetical protein
MSKGDGRPSSFSSWIVSIREEELEQSVERSDSRGFHLFQTVKRQSIRGRGEERGERYHWGLWEARAAED